MVKAEVVKLTNVNEHLIKKKNYLNILPDFLAFCCNIVKNIAENSHNNQIILNVLNISSATKTHFHRIFVDITT